MGILDFVIDYPGQGGMRPRRGKCVTTDNLSTITTTGYLDDKVREGFVLVNTDILDIQYSFSELTGSGNYGVFTVNTDGGTVTLTENAGDGGTILPGTNGNAAIYQGTNQMADAGALPILATNLPSQIHGQTIEAQLNTAAPDAFHALTGHSVNSISVMTGGEMVGLFGDVEVNAINGGELYGVEGRVTIDVNATGTADIAAFHARLGLESSNLGTAIVSCIACDMGYIAPIGTFSNLYQIVLRNATPSIPNAIIFSGGGADALMELTDNSGVVGTTYFDNAGTSSGSAGDTTRCNANKTLEIKVNGTPYFIPLFASNA